VKHKEGKPYDKADYYENPNMYESKFTDYLPYIHFLVEGIYWEAKYPRVLSIEDLRTAILEGKSKLLGVCDISADYMGSIEFTSRFNSIEYPFLVYDAVKETFFEKISEATEHSILYHCVDHLPAEMPKEASNHFGEKLFPFVEAVVNSNQAIKADDSTDLPEEILGAIICSHGELTKRYKYIE
jgi:alpha-aminoadipic semialdehyde synthase